MRRSGEGVAVPRPSYRLQGAVGLCLGLAEVQWGELRVRASPRPRSSLAWRLQDKVPDGGLRESMQVSGATLRHTEPEEQWARQRCFPRGDVPFQTKSKIKECYTVEEKNNQ